VKRFLFFRKQEAFLYWAPMNFGNNGFWCIFLWEVLPFSKTSVHFMEAAFRVEANLIFLARGILGQNLA
jgi:hypothetical protein